MRRSSIPLLSILSTALIGGVFAAGATAAAAPPAEPARPPSFSESTDVLAIEVPVTVTVDGAPVRGLQAADFEVWSGRERQAVVGFEVVDLASPAAAAPPGSPAAAALSAPLVAPAVAAGRRHVLMLFDLAYSQPAALERAREAARGVLRGALHPNDLVGLAAYSPTDGVRLLLGFTADREEAEQALAMIGKNQRVERNGDPLRLTLAEWDRGMQTPIQSTQDNAAKEAVAEAKQVAREQLYDQARQAAVAAERSQREEARTRVEAMTRSFTDLAHLLGSVPGRKTVLFLSEGFDSGLLLGNADNRTDREAIESGEVWRVDSEKRFGGGSTQGVIAGMLEEFRRAGCVIEAIDVGGLRAAADIQIQQVGSQQVGADAGLSTAGQDGLFVMAHETGGDLVRNTNDIGGALRSALARSNVTYVLTLAPQGVPTDGGYHPLVVKLKKGPRGAHVAARAGYYAPRPYAQRGAAERGLEAAGLIVAGEEGGRIGAALLAVPLVAPAGGAARVAVWIELDGETLLREQHGSTLKLEIFLYALDGRGKVRDHLAQTLAVDLAKLGTTVGERGLKVYGELNLPAGSYSLRTLVRNGDTGASAMRVAAVEVKNASATAQLLAPLVPEPANRWLNVPAQRAGAALAAYPFTVGTRPVMPSAQPVLIGGVDIPLCVFAYGLPATTSSASLRVRLRDRTGVEHDVPAILLDRAAAGSGLERLLLKLRLLDLAPGDYSLKVELLGKPGAVESSPLAVAVVEREPPQGGAP